MSGAKTIHLPEQTQFTNIIVKNLKNTYTEPEHLIKIQVTGLRIFKKLTSQVKMHNKSQKNNNKEKNLHQIQQSP